METRIPDLDSAVASPRSTKPRVFPQHEHAQILKHKPNATNTHFNTTPQCASPDLNTHSHVSPVCACLYVCTNLNVPHLCASKTNMASVLNPPMQKAFISCTREDQGLTHPKGIIADCRCDLPCTCTVFFFFLPCVEERKGWCQKRYMCVDGLACKWLALVSLGGEGVGIPSQWVLRITTIGKRAVMWSHTAGMGAHVS